MHSIALYHLCLDWLALMFHLVVLIAVECFTPDPVASQVSKHLLVLT